MKKQNSIAVLTFRSSIILSITLLSAEVAYARSTSKSLSYLIAASPSLVASSTPISASPTSPTNEDEKFNFELLHDAAKRNYDRYMNVVWGSFGFLLIAIGWIITSEKARIFLHKIFLYEIPLYGKDVKNVVWKVALGAIALIYVLHLISIGSAARTSNRLLQLMKDDPYVLSSIQKAAYYEQYKIPWFYPVFGGVLNGVLFILLFIMIFALKDWEEPPD
jgi:hypothetical protein